MSLDYFRLPIFNGGTGIAQFGQDLSEAGGAVAEGIRRRRKDADDREREARLLRHQMAMEAADAQRNTIAERRQLAAEEFTRGQTGLLNRRADAQELRDRTTFEQQQADRRRQAAMDIGKAFGAGAPNQAQVIAGATQFTNPRTGGQEGVQLAREPGTVAEPVMPMTPQQPEFVGPLEDPEAARARAIARFHGAGNYSPEARGNPNAQDTGTEPPPFDPEQERAAQGAGDQAANEAQGQQQARDQYGADVQTYQPRMEAFSQQQDAYRKDQENPRYRATFPGGESVTIDPQEQKNADLADKRAQAARLRQAAAQPGQLPDVARSMLLAADTLEAGIGNADKAPITNMNAAVQAQGFKAGESAKDREVKREAIHAKKIAKGLGAGGKVDASELIRMKEQGRPDSEIAARAAQLGIPMGGKNGWLQATKEVVRGGVASERNERAKAALEVSGPNGETGTAKSAQEARAVNNKNAAFAQLKNRLEALTADVEQNGSRVLMPSKQQHRDSLMAAFNAAARVYNGLGGTDASQRMEAEISGAAGTLSHGFLMGANPEVLRHLMKEAEAQHAANMQIRTRQPAPGAPHPSTEPVGATKVVNGKTYRKVGPNNWQPEAP